VSEVGTFIKYKDLKPGAAKSELIRRSASLLEPAEKAGDVMSLRQLYYQFVAKGWLGNEQANYNLLKEAVSDGRLMGLLSWTAIEDRTRALKGLQTWDGPAQALRQARKDYLTDMWAAQEWRPEVWVEKEAMEGVVGQVCGRLRVDFFCVRGYGSSSSLWAAGQRMAQYIRKGQRPIVFYLGDHDPSGLHMGQDISERLELFAGVPIAVQRIALSLPQIRQYSPPPNPAKKTDSRFKAYERETGLDESWELDALPTNVIRSLISNSVHKVTDVKKWDQSLAQEASDKEELDEFIKEAYPSEKDDGR
jgi:hypothetical protein